MIKENFRKPNLLDILKQNNIETPQKITKNYLRNLMSDGELVFLGDNLRQSIGALEKYGSEPNVFLFSRKFSRTSDYSNSRIKSLKGLLKIDSSPVLRNISKQLFGRINFGKKFAIENRILPSTLIKKSLEFYSAKQPPLGFYWVGIDGVARATTWSRAVAGAEIEVMRKKGEFDGEVLDRIAYGSNIRVKVSSRTEENKKYEFTLSRLPLYELGDMERYGGWLNMGHNSSDPDASYRGIESNQRVFPVIFWSALTIAGFYNASSFLKENFNQKLVRVNPFPIPTKPMISLIDLLRKKSLIVNKSKSIRPLNKTEMDLIIGEKTRGEEYFSNWFHQGKRDISYLSNSQ